MDLHGKVVLQQVADSHGPIEMVLHCPACGLQHVDAPEPARGWTNPPHRSHLCAGCGTVWRPADVETTGVRAILTSGQRDTWTPGPPFDVRDLYLKNAQFHYAVENLAVLLRNGLSTAAELRAAVALAVELVARVAGRWPADQ